MSELCLTIEEQVWIARLVAVNTQAGAKFMSTINQDNITKHEREYVALMTEVAMVSKNLSQLMKKIEYNINNYERFPNG